MHNADNKGCRAEAYRAYVEDAASPVGNEGRRKKPAGITSSFDEDGKHRPYSQGQQEDARQEYHEHGQHGFLLGVGDS